jgi:hypothetical protein
MAQRTRDLTSEIARLNRLIARIEAKPRAELPIWSSTLSDLLEERKVLRLLIQHRQIEAAKKIVSFHYWRDGPWAA